MRIWDIFKKKKREKEERREKEEKLKEVEKLKKERPKEKVKEKVEKEVPVAPPVPKERKRKTGVAPLVLKTPHVTEKGTFLMDKNQYGFKVFPKAGKQEIKKAIEEAYGVDVLKVRTIKIPRKQKRLGRSLGWRKGYKKAIVTLKKGQKIEVLPR